MLEEHDETLQDLMSATGLQLELPCRISAGNPIPVISWFKDGYKIYSTSSLDGISVQVCQYFERICTYHFHAIHL